MFIPIWALLLVGMAAAVLIGWMILALAGRNPLPFPDPGSRIFSAASAKGKDAIVELLSGYGIRERFQANTGGVQRSIMWDGTIINLPSAEVAEKLGFPAASIGLVVKDPESSARSASDFLQSKGFTAEVVLDAEPELPIAFVKTDAMAGTVLNFRKHVIHLPRPE